MNFVSLVGKLHGPKKGTYRYIEVSRPYIDGTAENLEIPCQYWTHDEHNLFMSVKEGAMLVIRGRIDMNNAIGMFIIVEQFVLVKE